MGGNANGISLRETKNSEKMVRQATLGDPMRGRITSMRECRSRQAGRIPKSVAGES